MLYKNYKEGKTTNIILAHPTDPRSPRLGGANRYVYNIMNCLQTGNKGFNLFFLGVDLCNKCSYKQSYTFIPLLKNNESPWIYLLKLIILLPFIPLPDKGIIHVQRSYFIIPFLIWKKKYKKIVTLHTFPLEYLRVNYPTLYLLTRHPYGLLEKIILKNVDLSIAVNEKIATYLRKKYRINNTIVMSGSAIDLNVFHPLDPKDKLKERNRIGLSKNEFVLLFVGRLEKIKRVDLLIEAVKLLKVKYQFNNFKLIIVGDGSLRNYLKKLVKLYNLDEKVLFTGSVLPNEVKKYYNVSNLLVLTSESEATPNVIKEALACGLPVLTTNVGDVDKLKNLPCLKIIPVDIQPMILAEIIYRFVNINNSHSVPHLCRIEITKKFGLNTFCRNLILVYKHLI